MIKTKQKIHNKHMSKKEHAIQKMAYKLTIAMYKNKKDK